MPKLLEIDYHCHEEWVIWTHLVKKVDVWCENCFFVSVYYLFCTSVIRCLVHNIINMKENRDQILWLYTLSYSQKRITFICKYDIFPQKMETKERNWINFLVFSEKFLWYLFNNWIGYAFHNKNMRHTQEWKYCFIWRPIVLISNQYVNSFPYH